MLAILLAKDFLRVWRNPWPWVLNLALPLAITALFGFAFGGKGEAQIAKIKVGIVDEDGSFFGGFLRSALSQGEAAKRMEVSFPSREDGLKLIRESKLSALVVVPTNFTGNFLRGESGLALEVIKNPAERFYPAIVEELMGVGVTGVNAVHRNFSSEFPRVRAALSNEFSLVKLGELASEIGQRIERAGSYLNPPLVQFERETIQAEKKEEGPGMSIFMFILPGMASAFLLFLADHSMRDVHRETRLRTFDRLRTVRSGTGVFIASKVIYSGLSVVLGSAILFGAGAFIFGIRWASPGLLALACAGYAVFAAGLMAMLVALIPNERKSETINNIIFFGIAFAGGSYFPADQLPKFMREFVCPWMPNFWFIEAVRGMQIEPGISGALLVVLKLAAAGVVLAFVASALLQRRLARGVRG